MPNMSYCRFENTFSDLEDCSEALNKIYEGDGEYKKLKLSASEKKYAVKLVMLCAEIVDRVKETLNFDATDFDADDVAGSLDEAFISLREQSNDGGDGGDF